MSTPPATTSVALTRTRQLSPTQRAFLASQLRHPGTTALNMALVVTFDETVNTDLFATAFDQVVRSADVLRTQIDPANQGSAVVATEPTAPTEIMQLDVDRLDEWADEQVRRPLDLAVSCYRSVLLDHGNGTSWFILIHHIATDAGSMAHIVERTIAAFHGEEPEPSHFYSWADGQQSGVDSRRSSFWEARSVAPRTGRVYRASDRTTGEASRRPLELAAEDHEQIDTALQSHYRLLSPELSLAALLVTTSSIYLHRLSGALEFAIGVPVHHRNTADAADLIGPTLGVYPVDVRIEPDDTYGALHRRVARSLMTVLGNAHPGLTPPGDYDLVVNVIPNAAPSTRAPSNGDPSNGGTSAVTRWIHSGAIDPDHTMRVQATRYGRAASSDDRVDIDLDLHHQVANTNQLERAPAHFAQILRGAIEAPDSSIYSRSMAASDEVEAITSAETAADFAAEPALPADRLRAALLDNHQVVLSARGESLTGHELWGWATNVATDLVRDVEPGGRVGVLLDCSVETVVAIYACILAGLSFVPLDPNQPPARITSLSTRAKFTRTLRSADEIARLRPRDDGQPAAEVVPPAGPEDEAYLLFTSGSTGAPKGVPITNRGLARYLEFAVTSYFADDESPVAPLFTALTFDLTITTLFAPILAGGRIVVLEESGPSALATLASMPELTWAKATPSHLEVLLPLLKPGHALATIVVGGEAFRSDLAARLLNFQPAMAIFNEYGPTEAVVGCMIHRVDPASNDDHVAVPIGVPAPGVTLRVVDAGGQRVPIGTAGELWISHVGLTAGSIDNPESPHKSSDDSFVLADGMRFYRSGDLVERSDDLTLTYLGRIDEQIKVGGIRLDPSEVEQAMLMHPAIAQVAVRYWTPEVQVASRHCVRCGLPSNVPGVVFDDAGVCNTCLSYDQVAPVASSWFRTEQDLVDRMQQLTQNSTGEYDCLHLLSGGKDSTYALYRLVALGFRPYTLMLDNGFISGGAKENVRRVAEHLDLDYEFATTEHMNAIFRDSLATHSDVCHGCYKTIYTLATNRAVELNIPVIVTGLSRGQLFETRLIPGQFQHDRFDPEAIDRAVVEARKRYHRARDLPNRLLDTTVFETDDIFESLEYIDIYRYLDVELEEVLSFLENETPWQRPADTGRSSNCLINVAGIHAHQIEQGYHNYAEPYAWDVRLGHKQRDEAMAELHDPVDTDEISSMLARVGYEPTPRQVLTGWFQLDASADRAPTPAELRAFLAERLPRHAIPSAFVQVDGLATTTNGKLDTAVLPAPDRVHRAAVGASLEPESELESLIITKWEAMLGLSPIAPNDDFFALGGDSLAAVTMVVDLAHELDILIREELAFANTTPRDLARAIDQGVITAEGAPAASASSTASRSSKSDPPASVVSDDPPPLSAGELSILFDQQQRPDERMYNVARTFLVAGTVDADRLERAVIGAASRHEPLTWTYGSPRRRLDEDWLVDFVALTDAIEPELATADLTDWHRAPFDLADGPLLRCRIRPLTNGTTLVALAIHHVSGDNQGLDLLWSDIDKLYVDEELSALPTSYSDFCAWQRESDEMHRSFWQAQGPFPSRLSRAELSGPSEADGYVSTSARVTPERLRTTAGQTGVMSTVAAAAAAVMPYFDGDEVEVNLITATRDHAAATNLFGYLLNPVPLTFTRDLQQPLSALVGAAARSVGEVLSHRTYPFAEIVNDARQRGVQEPSGSVLVAYNDRPHRELAGMAVLQEVVFNGSSVADVTFFAEPRNDHVHLGIEYRGAVVDRATAELLLERFDTALLAVTTGDEIEVGALASPEPSMLVGEVLADTELVVAKMLRHVTERAGYAAVETANGSLTWQQLGARASQVASQLIADGAGPGDRVAVRVSRSTELPVAILGVLLAGASYVPVDPGYPPERIDQTLQRSGATREITDRGAARLGSSLAISTTGVAESAWNDAAWDDIRGGDTAAAGQVGSADDEAYLIFTSGSTGEADGVPISHAQLAASTNARAQFYDEGPERFLLLSSVAFDSSIVGLFWTLANGGTLVLPSDQAAHDIDALVEVFRDGDLSHVLCVPTLYDALLERGGDTGWPAHVIVAGEACTDRLVARHFARHGASLLTNEYGPTEATVWAAAHRCEPDDVGPIPIGAPVAGTWLAVVDAAGHVRPQGHAGELIIGGPNVAVGYLHRSSEQFAHTSDLVGLPTAVEGSVFFTRDRAVIANGTAYFLGRVDDQLNVGGTRVEPAEIEAALEAVATIDKAVVVGVDVRTLDQLLAEVAQVADTEVLSQAMRSAADAADPSAALRDELLQYGRPDVRMIAHVTQHVSSDRADSNPTTIDPAELRQAVAHLPVTHRPALFRSHHLLPLLPNGKIDRTAARSLPVDLAQLNQPSPAATRGGDATTDTELVTTTCQWFAEVLKSGPVAADDSFFDLGGDSLRAIELLRLIEERTGTPLATSTIHNSPTPRLLASQLCGADVELLDAADNTIVMRLQTTGSATPVFALHNLGVDGAMWRPMMGHLGSDYPLYGIADPFALLDPFGDDYNLDHRPNIEDTAARYVSHIESIASTGPVALIGFCVGGVFGYEVAQQLTAAGRDVQALIIVFDRDAPHLGYDENWLTLPLMSYRRSEQSPGAYLIDVLKRRAFMKRVNRRLEGYALAVAQRLHLPLTERLKARQYVEEGIDRVESYEHKPYPGAMTVIRSTEDPRVPTRLGDGGWGDLVPNLTVNYVSGVGERMLYEPHVSALAEAVRHALSK